MSDETTRDPVENDRTSTVEPQEARTRRSNSMPLKLAAILIVVIVLLVMRFAGSVRMSTDREFEEPIEPARGTSRPDPSRYPLQVPQAEPVIPTAEAPQLPPPPVAAGYAFAAIAAESPMRRITRPANLDRRDTGANAPGPGEIAAQYANSQPPVAPPGDGDGGEPPAPLTGADKAADRWEEFGGGDLRNREAVHASFVDPPSAYLAQEGAHLPAVLLTNLNTDLPSLIEARTITPLYDSATGRIRLLPEGCRVVGSPDHRVSVGQGRAVVTWHTLYLPDGRKLDLLDEPGVDQLGAGGLPGRVNHHMGRLYMHSLFAGVIGAAFQISQDTDQVTLSADASQTAGAAVGQSLLDTSDAITQRELSYLKPTIVKRLGEAFAITLTREYIFEGPYVHEPANQVRSARRSHGP